ncbi:uncharacterized protein EMH_0076510 [Eimeria mitis]|uniref:Uncharacterized protein n=1 Tax=Eimeria mitis TaxID=44415 RepID=U6K4G1_9EIME|nr:uncharacterized protein EMH_0076510 [Eimeria mitis]CDJ32620.1 hypothetical protein EMH_0076510 [Eimeria mitis]
MLLVLNEAPAPPVTAASRVISGATQERTQRVQQAPAPAARTPQRQQLPATLPFDFSSIVVDGGRVAQFPAGGNNGPPPSTSSAPASSTATSPLAPAGGTAAASLTSTIDAQVKALIRRRAEEAVAAATADPASLSIIRVQNPVIGDAIKAAVDERQAATLPRGTDAAQPAEAGAAMKQLMELLEKEYEAQKKVRCKHVVGGPPGSVASAALAAACSILACVDRLYDCIEKQQLQPKQIYAILSPCTG